MSKQLKMLDIFKEELDILSPNDTQAYLFFNITTATVTLLLESYFEQQIKKLNLQKQTQYKRLKEWNYGNNGSLWCKKCNHKSLRYSEHSDEYSCTHIGCKVRLNWKKEEIC